MDSNLAIMIIGLLSLGLLVAGAVIASLHSQVQKYRGLLFAEKYAHYQTRMEYAKQN